MTRKPKKTASTKLAKAASAYASEKYGITLPWEFIIGLVDWFMSQCGDTAEQFARTAHNPTWYQEYALRREAFRRLRRSGASRSKARRGSWAAVDSIITTADEADSKTLGKVFGELCH